MAGICLLLEGIHWNIPIREPPLVFPSFLRREKQSSPLEGSVRQLADEGCYRFNRLDNLTLSTGILRPAAGELRMTALSYITPSVPKLRDTSLEGGDYTHPPS